MKKKIILSIITLFVLSIFTISVRADETWNIPVNNSFPASIPSNIPAVGQKLKATITQAFDYSKIEFDNGDSHGAQDMKKIILGVASSELELGAKKRAILIENGNENPTPEDILAQDLPLTLNSYYNSWFTAYCLDGNLKRPEYGLYSSADFLSASSDLSVAIATGQTEQAYISSLKLMDDIVLAAIANDSNIQSKFENYKNTNIYSINVSNGEYNASFVPYYQFDNIEATDDAGKMNEILTKLKSGTTQLTVNLANININGDDISTLNGDSTPYVLSFKGMDILFQDYVSTAELNEAKYAKALWILEHTYPTVSLEDALATVGTSLDAVKNNITTIHTGETLSADELNTLAENYVYATVQYAIWKVYGKAGIGNSITNSAELNKLYQFLIQDRNVENYESKVFSDELTVTQPEKGKDIFKETNTSYIYGPYKVTYNVLSAESGLVNLSIGNSDTTGIKIVDAEGNIITAISKDGVFYVECAKTAKIGSVKINMTLNNVKTFAPNTNRGRTYYPTFALGQNVISGGKLVSKNIEQSVDFVYNAKTGVENVAVLLMVTLVAFSLGYLVLSYKNKPVELS